MITWSIQLSSGGHKTFYFLLWSKGLRIMPCAPFSFPAPWTGNPYIHHTTPDSSRACLSFFQSQEAGLRNSGEIARQFHHSTSAAKMQSTMELVLLHQHLFFHVLFRASKMICFTPCWSERGALSVASKHAGAKEVITSYSAQTQVEKYLPIQ